MFETEHWQSRLDELCIARHVPGATLAVLVDGEIHELATGVLNRTTGVAATPDSVFLAGSVAKTYTATAIMALVDRGELDVDARVREVLPDFVTPDEAASDAITVRQLLSHTGGLTCDFTLDTGRGDDCVARFVEAAADVPLDCPPGAAISYSSVGYAVLGRIVEVVTGATWDEAIERLIIRPLGLSRTMTLPEQALRFRAAIGHSGAPDEWPLPADVWDPMPRSAGPYGRVVVSAGDVVRFARMHLDGGAAPDGTRVLSPESVAALQHREVDTVDKWTFHADGWGLGWALYDWDGVRGFGHDGSAVTQQSWLRVVPEQGVAVALLANSDCADGLYADLMPELLGELAGVTLPPPFSAPDESPTVDLSRWKGEYRREGVVTTVTQRPDGTGRLRYELVGGMSGFSEPLEGDLVAVSDTVFAAVGLLGAGALPVVFDTLPDGAPCLIFGMRVTPRTAYAA